MHRPPTLLLHLTLAASLSAALAPPIGAAEFHVCDCSTGADPECVVGDDGAGRARADDHDVGAELEIAFVVPRAPEAHEPLSVRHLPSRPSSARTLGAS